MTRRTWQILYLLSPAVYCAFVSAWLLLFSSDRPETAAIAWIVALWCSWLYMLFHGLKSLGDRESGDKGGGFNPGQTLFVVVALAGPWLVLPMRG